MFDNCIAYGYFLINILVEFSTNYIVESYNTSSQNPLTPRLPEYPECRVSL